jgi:hypothetical protein
LLAVSKQFPHVSPQSLTDLPVLLSEALVVVMREPVFSPLWVRNLLLDDLLKNNVLLLLARFRLLPLRLRLKRPA